MRSVWNWLRVTLWVVPGATLTRGAVAFCVSTGRLTACVGVMLTTVSLHVCQQEELDFYDSIVVHCNRLTKHSTHKSVPHFLHSDELCKYKIQEAGKWRISLIVTRTTIGLFPVALTRIPLLQSEYPLLPT